MVRKLGNMETVSREEENGGGITHDSYLSLRVEKAQNGSYKSDISRCISNNYDYIIYKITKIIIPLHYYCLFIV